MQSLITKGRTYPSVNWDFSDSRKQLGPHALPDATHAVTHTGDSGIRTQVHCAKVRRLNHWTTAAKSNFPFSYMPKWATSPLQQVTPSMQITC